MSTPVTTVVGSRQVGPLTIEVQPEDKGGTTIYRVTIFHVHSGKPPIQLVAPGVEALRQIDKLVRDILEQLGYSTGPDFDGSRWVR